ncbi:SPRY domain-containing protein [Priestia sp. FSL H7-0729]
MSISWRSFNGVSLSNNELTATLPTHLQSTIATGNGVSSGKWYWEVIVQSAGAIVGVTSTTTGGQIWNTVNHRGYFSGAAKWGGTSGTSYGATFGLGDVISVLLDMEAGTIEFWKNGVTQGVAFTDIKPLGTVYPFYGNPTGTSVPSTATTRFESKAFSYQVPQGYLQYDIKHKILLSSGGRVYSASQDIISTENAIPPMTSNTSPSGEVSASSQYTTTTYYPYFAFNQTNTGAGDCWVTTNGQADGWLQYKFNIPKVISKYVITNRNNGTVYDNTPKSWTFEGSVDGGNWILLDRIENNPAWTSVEPRSFNFINETAYLYYRLSVTFIHSGTYLAVGKLEMYEYIKGFMYSLPSSDEETFIKYGVDQIKLNSPYVKKVSVEKIKGALGSGKIFEHTVDMSKRRVDKITLG